MTDLSLPHPFDPLSPEEIRLAGQIVRDDLAGSDVNFRVITLLEPAKDEMMVFLEQEHSGVGSALTPSRVAKVQAYVGEAGEKKRFTEFMINLNTRSIQSKEELPGKHSYIDADYMRQVEKACLADFRVQDEIRSLNLPEGATVVVEPWAYATDGMNDMSERVTMCWFYMRLSTHPDANYYAYPLDLCAEVSEALEVTRLYRLPSGAEEHISDVKKRFDSGKVHGTSEYHPDLAKERRQTTRPYHVSQPEGPSFKFFGNSLNWEKWTLRVGFNYREGMTLHDVRYDGRSLFYRLSLSEMFVPYGDSRCPYPRKGAFDLGNDGAGVNANNLQLGCDCLGHIRYIDAWHNTSSGDPVRLPHIICCHEIDDGILWKHTNPRTGNAVVTRSRVLVLQTIITVSNYEYIFLFHFGQDASIHYEVRATGILSTAPIDVGDKVPYGTTVAPGVLAPYHQHLFCLRIDPALDGRLNSLAVEESHPMPIDDEQNPFGVGYVTNSNIVSEEAGLDLNFASNRVFKIINENKINPVTHTPVGFKLLPCYSQMLLAHPSSYHARRSEYAAHAVWVTRYSDDELYAAGKHTMQSQGGEGIASWIRGRKRDTEQPSSVRNEDIVVWHTFGSTHNPRIEDWPVMPCEKMVVGLKPLNFFLRNPGLDVAVSTQHSNQSTLVSDEGGGCCVKTKL
ncbi:copper amine oxidase [Diplodia corticola]|uniref:Amine oxidase n=1 Tax=Diplodia corticola TaxID=236234 RepID=A0A1J9S258_9PEZI|nr:copper amine oxidase [Diplodia corticola]OJD33733.1 copper amine oxidase [Diplodia corticola]